MRRIIWYIWYSFTSLLGLIAVTAMAILVILGIVNKGACSLMWEKIHQKHLRFCPEWDVEERGLEVPVKDLKLRYYNKEMGEWYCCIEMEDRGTLVIPMRFLKSEKECRQCDCRMYSALDKRCPEEGPKAKNL